MKSISIVFVLFVMLSMVYIIPDVYAEDDDEDREGFGEMKREREQEHQDEGTPIGTDIGNVILYGTIAAIGVSVAYTAFKIISSKRKSSSKS